MNKAELIEYENKKHAEKMAKIDELPGAAFTVEGIGAFAGDFGDVYLDCTANTFNEMVRVLHDMRAILGAYKLESYWVPSQTLLCVRYSFGRTLLWFRLHTESQNETQALLDKVSGGKCRIVEESRPTISCSLEGATNDGRF